MNTMSRLATGLALAAALGLSAGASAQAAEVTLTVHTFQGPTSPTQRFLLEPWAERVKEQSGGRIEVEIFPSMSMGGAPPELYSQVRDGAADIVWTLIGYTPGLFPRTEVFELPTVHLGTAQQSAIAMAKNFELIAEDFAQVKPLLIYPHAGNAIHTRNRAVNSMADLRGMKLRTPSRTGAWLIEAWGAEPVGMPVPELPQALSRGAVDGALVPFEIFMPYSLHELTSFSIEGPGHGRFGASVFVFAMNLDRYNALPDDLKAVIDANSGTNIAEWVGQVWDDIEGPGRSAQEGTGATMIELTPEAMAEFDTAAEAVTARWVAEATSRGVDGQALVDAARAAVQAEMQ